MEERLRRLGGERQRPASFRLRPAAFKGNGLRSHRAGALAERLWGLSSEGRGHDSPGYSVLLQNPGAGSSILPRIWPCRRWRPGWSPPLDSARNRQVCWHQDGKPARRCTIHIFNTLAPRIFLPLSSTKA